MLQRRAVEAEHVCGGIDAADNLLGEYACRNTAESYTVAAVPEGEEHVGIALGSSDQRQSVARGGKCSCPCELAAERNVGIQAAELALQDGSLFGQEQPAALAVIGADILASDDDAVAVGPYIEVGIAHLPYQAAADP